jgi:lipopolysaccharide transport system permease protein
MYLTPIVYAPKVEVSFLANIISLKPLTYLVGFSRDLLTRDFF